MFLNFPTVKTLWVVILSFSLLFISACTTAEATPTIIIENVRIFDGQSDTLSGPSYVVIRGNTIEQVSSRRPSAQVRAESTLINGEGHTLMPGLIDAHWHATMAAIPMMKAMTVDASYVHIVAARQAEATLLRGFTTVRDVGGPVFGLKLAIDEGITPGPRIFPSGATISQTGGHGDFRLRHEVPRTDSTPLSHLEQTGITRIADGVDEVRRSAREQLMLGASQIKLMAGGGVSSIYDPLDVSQYSVEEFRVAVEAAENWGTYVMVHAYTPRAIRMAIEAGVRSIEHGQLADEETARLMAENDVWWSLQPFLDDEHSNPQVGESRLKQLQVARGTDRAVELAREHGVKLAWGTDILFNAANTHNQGAMLAKMTRWFTPAEVLRMATSTNAELLSLAGPRNPYPGRLGVIEEGALADLILVKGDPLEDIQLISNPTDNFSVIMKNGVVYKNTLQ
ncbi:MAG: amidohydrolase family protein [Idiomarina sp.]|nr:amidohydrolase family protein [Idiomarina sp.]